MPEFNVSYDLIVKQGDSETVDRTRSTACYGGLFNNHYKKGSVVKFVAYFGTEKKEFIEAADWWLENFIEKVVPERMKGTYLVEPLEDKSCTPTWHPWVKVTFDTTKVCSFDLYAALVTFRYSQENPRLVRTVMEKVAQGADLNKAFISAHEVLESGYGHALLSYPMQYRLKKDFPGWTFKGAWETVPDDIIGRTKPYSVDRRRSGTVTDYLSPDARPRRDEEREKYFDEDERRRDAGLEEEEFDEAPDVEEDIEEENA